MVKPVKAAKEKKRSRHSASKVGYIAQDLSAKILKQAQEQQADLNAESIKAATATGDQMRSCPEVWSPFMLTCVPPSLFLSLHEFAGGDSDDEDAFSVVSNDDYGEGVAHEGDFIVDTETTEEEEALLRRFMPDAAPERRDLASIIMAKIEEVCV